MEQVRDKLVDRAMLGIFVQVQGQRSQLELFVQQAHIVQKERVQLCTARQERAALRRASPLHRRVKSVRKGNIAFIPEHITTEVLAQRIITVQKEQVITLLTPVQKELTVKQLVCFLLRSV